MTRIFSLTLALLLASGASHASDPDAIADEYLEAIQTQHWTRMAALLAEGAVYQDFTMQHFGSAAIDLEGVEAIIGFWRSSSEDSGTSSIRYDVRKRFTAGPTVVLDIEANVVVSGEYWEVPLPEVEASGTLIVYLEIKEGKVEHHIDFVDYAAAMRRIEEQKATALRAPGKTDTIGKPPAKSPEKSLIEGAHLRVARPTNNLDALVPFYRDGLGFEVIASFEDHEGWDGVMLGHPKAPYHLEFTRHRGHKAPQAPTRDDLLVFYLPDREHWKAAVERMRRHGFEPVTSENPYWDKVGKTFEDPDGYRVVLQNAPWS